MSITMKRNIHTSGLSAFFPFSSPFLDIENEGILLLGLNKKIKDYSLSFLEAGSKSFHARSNMFSKAPAKKGVFTQTPTS